MEILPRIYGWVLNNHFQDGPEMAFLAGPRQVGKTTLARRFREKSIYLNWDNETHRRLIMAGPDRVADHIGLHRSPVVIFDELHKFPHWKGFLKGFYDTHAAGGAMKILVTGSARLDIYRKGGDSLMGRYFLYRMHPLSLAELLRPEAAPSLIRSPAGPAEEKWRRLQRFGGFPQPFLRGTPQFYNRWKRTRSAQLFREDIFDISRVQEIRRVELLAEHIIHQAGQLTSFASLAGKIRASQDSIRRWTTILESLYFCFSVRPWHANITRSLRKEPKFYLWDWALVTDPGARHENLIASHLLKAVHLWTDLGLGEFGLFFLRTKDKREVDFVVTRDNMPWFLVEVKSSDAPLSPHLAYFQKATGAQHAFQVQMNAPFVQADCFSHNRPIRVPAQTLLSQLA